MKHLLILAAVCCSAADAAEWKFSITWSKDIHAKPFTGRVYVFFSARRAEPRFGPSWFRPEPFISKDVRNWPAGKPVVLSSADKDVLSFPKKLADLPLAGARAQGVVRFNPLERVVGRGPGNGYSSTQRVAGNQMAFAIDKIVPPKKFTETTWGKELVVESKLLSKFHGRKVMMRAGVILPASYHRDANRRFPTIYSIPGFGGTHHSAQRRFPVRDDNKEGVEFLRVILDPSCPLGHHVFADSANNGPVGKALTTELIPALEKEFRAIAKPTARFLTGHSSGGWSSLWLQVTYPQFFGGTWSTAPDGVDFRDFHQANLYEPATNLYIMNDGEDRPLGRAGNRVMFTFKQFDKMEVVLGHGGQLLSFEAVFGRRGKDGKPESAWDRKGGRLNRKAVEHWKKYDIRLVMEKNWKTLAPKLKGKIHVFMGDRDNFYLEGATRLLKASHQKLKSDAVIEIFPGLDHGSLLTPTLRSRMRREMVAAFIKHHPDNGIKKISGDSSIIPADAKLEELWSDGEFTEGVAVAADGKIYFSDIAFQPKNPGRVLQFDPGTGKVRVFCNPSRKSNGLMFDANGRLLAACGANNGARAICEITTEGKVKPLVTSYEGKRFNSPNDLVVLADGTIYFSDPRYVGPEKIEIPHMSVYRVSPDLKTVTRVTTDIEKPNGVHISPDGKTLYVAETNNGSVDVTRKDPTVKRGRMTLNAFPIHNDGTLGKKKMLVDFGKGPGVDGMTLDKDGNIYAAVRADAGFGIMVFSPAGKKLATIPTPSLPTNCCFGIGKEATTLYVTAGKGLYRIRLKSEGFHPARAKR